MDRRGDRPHDVVTNLPAGCDIADPLARNDPGLGDWDPMRRAPLRSILSGAAALVIAGSGALAACGDDEGRTGEAYCGTVQENLAALASPAIAAPADIELTIELYRSIADRAPAAVEP